MKEFIDDIVRNIEEYIASQADKITEKDLKRLLKIKNLLLTGLTDKIEFYIKVTSIIAELCDIGLKFYEHWHPPH